MDACGIVGQHWMSRSVPSSVTCIAVKRQNIAHWPPRRHRRCLVKDRGFADADQKLRHSCPPGQGADEVTAGLKLGEMAQCACRHPGQRALQQHGGQRFAAPQGVMAGVLVGGQNQHCGLVLCDTDRPLVVSANREGPSDVDPIIFGRRHQ